jgi:hypothetical protein
MRAKPLTIEKNLGAAGAAGFVDWDPFDSGRCGASADLPHRANGGRDGDPKDSLRQQGRRFAPIR